MADFNPTKHLTKLQGKDYLEVKWRIVWFRSDHEDGAIDTEILTMDGGIVIRARVSVGGQVIATGHGTAPLEGQGTWKGREVEKAETAAIGRALAHAGYGTQFTGEDEEDLADSPMDRKQSKAVPKSKPASPFKKTLNNDAPSSDIPDDATDKQIAIWEQVKGNYFTFQEMRAHLSELGKAKQITKDTPDDEVILLLSHKLQEAG